MKRVLGKLSQGRLRRRVTLLLIVAALSGTLLLIQSIAARKVISASFEHLEQTAGQRSMDQAVEAFAADLHQLAISNHDYAVWDYAYDFVANRDPRFVSSNLAPEALDNMNVDLLCMIDNNGAQVLAIEGDPEQPSAPSRPASPAIIQQVRAHLGELLAAG